MYNFTIRNEWICNENDDIVVMPLRKWFEYFQIKPEILTDASGKAWQLWRSNIKAKRNGLIDIYRCGGYGITHDELDKYLDKPFRTGNADFDVKLVQCAE